MLKQGRDIGDIANLAVQHVKVDVFLEGGTHPLEGGLPCLREVIWLRSDADHPSNVTEELLCAMGGYDRWIGTGQQEQEVDRTSLLQ